MYGYVTHHNFCTVNHTFILDTTIRKQKSISYIYILYIFKEICFCTVTVGVFSMLQMVTGYWNRVYTMKFQAYSTLAQHPAIWHITHEGKHIHMPYLKLTTTSSFTILSCQLVYVYKLHPITLQVISQYWRKILPFCNLPIKCLLRAANCVALAQRYKKVLRVIEV